MRFAGHVRSDQLADLARLLARIDPFRAGATVVDASVIHDEIGASLTRITLLSQSTLTPPGARSRERSVLQQISETAREATQSFEEIVWALAPRHDTLESMVCYMAKFSQDFLADAHVRCRLNLPTTVPACPLGADIRHNLFLAFKETLNNAVKHAAATEVAVSLGVESAAFILTVQDNGRGIVAVESGLHNPPSIRGNGLMNLRRRLASVGGSCEISCCDGGGTIVTFSCPIQHADNAAAESIHISFSKSN